MSEKPDRDQQSEAPTPKRKRDAANKGDLLRSQDLSAALAFAAAAAWLAIAGPMWMRDFGTLLRVGLTFGARDLDQFDPATRAVSVASPALTGLVALFAALIVAGIAGSALLGSLGFRSNAFAPKANKLSPLAGLSRMFGPHGLAELLKSLVKSAVILALGLWLLGKRQSALFALGLADAHAASAVIGTLLLDLTMLLAGALAAIALFDVPLQYFQRLRRLRMTKQEVKDELRDSDGNPEVKMMTRQKRMELLSASARKAVSEADVILTNPTHFAVALRYKPGRDAAPTVVARGRGETALAIRELARDRRVPQFEYPQLARAIYFTARAGQPIAQDLYLAVATILVFVFNLDRALAEGALPPQVEVPENRRFDEHGRRTR